jgi:dienelactone hydrolase
MKIIDVILLLGTITIASCLIIIPKRINGILLPLVTLTIILAIVQLLFAGYYWQYVPSYILILFLIMWALFLKDTNRNIKKKFFHIFLFFLILATVVPWSIFLPIPKLTEPQGYYKVGTRIFRWIDFNRAEQITSDPNDKRNVVVQAWYPTEQDAKGTHSSYLDGMDNLPEKIGIIPGFLFDHYDQIETYGVLNASISKAQNQWPVILFLTGNGASRAFYTSLATGLASYGYVVLTIDHPYEAAITQLTDGKIVTTIEVHLKDDPDLIKFMKVRLDVRVADIQFVINQIGNPKGSTDSFLLSLDKNRIGIAGHSLGGASAGVAMAFDSRVKAAANIDGTLYGALPKPNGPRPFLLLESNKGDRSRFVRYEAGNQQFFKQFGGGYRYEIRNADHLSFTDAPLLLAFPARFLASHIFEFGQNPTRTHNATVDILNTFFNGALNGKLSDIDSITARHHDIIRKPIH